MKNYFLFSLLLLFFAQKLPAQSLEKDRVIILSDIEADPDDTQSFIRLFLYSNQIDIKGLVATTSCWLQNKVHPASIKKLIEAYRKVYPNLLQHEEGFTSPETLLNLVKASVPKYGMLGVGEGQDTDWTLKEQVTFDDTTITSTDWASYPIFQFSDMPAIEVVVINRPNLPALGGGEVVLPPTGAALANAIYKACGKRIYDLPITPKKIIE